MGIHLKDIIEGICRKAIQDENGKNIDSTYLKKTGDTKDNTITFESDDTENVNNWTNVNYLVSGEKQSSIFKKISTMFKNIRWIYNILSVDDIPNYIYGIKTEGKIGNTIKILNNMKAKASHVGVSESNGITNIQYNYPDGSNLMTVSGEDSLRTALYNATDKISSQVASLNTDIQVINKKYTYAYVNGTTGKRCKISFSGRFNAIVSVVGTNPQSLATFIVQGYGIYISGSAHRICVTRVTDADYATNVKCQPVNNEMAALIELSNSDAWVTVFMLLGELHNVTNPA